MRAQLLLAVSRNIQRSRPTSSIKPVRSAKILSSFTKTLTRPIFPVASRQKFNMADDDHHQIDIKSFTDRAEKAVCNLSLIDYFDVICEKAIDSFQQLLMKLHFLHFCSLQNVQKGQGKKITG